MKSNTFYHQFLVNHERRFIYCFVPKVACSSLKWWFVQVAGVTLEDIGSNIHLFVEQNFSLARLPKRRADQLLRSKHYFKFAFLRDPFDRLVSAYLNKIIVPEGPGFAPIRQVQRGRIWELRKRYRYTLRRLKTGKGADFSEGITFREFIYHVARWYNPRRLDTHWRPQTLILGDVPFDFIGLMENMESDFAEVCRHLGLPGHLPVTNSVRSDALAPSTECCADWPTARLRRLASYPAYHCFYTPALIEIVKRLYHQDCEKFEQLATRHQQRRLDMNRRTNVA